ncbi:MAG: hypothetical protein K6A38_07855 [Lachnospiraceae bacterium]|nr:hypothetical protein [Lachnospiraceae bacterium]
MKKPVVDYRKFRFSKINEPEFKHLWLILGWVFYLMMYFITDHFIPVERCHVVHSRVDDIIPFNEYFIIAYASWYILIVATLLYFLLYDPGSFANAQKFIICTQVVGVITYIVWPSIQLLRPEHFERNNIFTYFMGIIYTVDSPTGVCPSLHVGFSLALLSAWLKKEGVPKLCKFAIILWVGVICISVCFVKQHSFVDVWAAFLMCAVIELILFGKEYYLPLLKRCSGSEMRVEE